MMMDIKDLHRASLKKSMMKLASLKSPGPVDFFSAKTRFRFTPPRTAPEWVLRSDCTCSSWRHNDPAAFCRQAARTAQLRQPILQVHPFRSESQRVARDPPCQGSL